MSSPIRLDIKDGIARITFARPQCRNALSRQLLTQVVEALAQARAGGARAVVLAGEGRFFSAGADLKELTGTAQDASFDDEVAAAVDAIRSSALPVLAAIEGGCIGAALDLALACDLRVVACGAFLELPAIRMGLLYNPHALARMAKRVPHATLARLLLAGERITGADALAAGLATHVEDTDAVARAVDIAGRFRALPAEAVSATKGFLCASATDGLDLEAWERRRMALLDSSERKAAVERARKPSGQ